MGLLGKLLRRPVVPEALVVAPCSHRIMRARWDRPEDVGHEDRITSYKCETCSELFPAQFARELMNLA